MKRRNWPLISSFFLTAFLAADVVLLSLQNRELKNRLRTVTMLSEVDPLQPGERVDPFEIQSLDGNTTQLNYTDSTKRYLLFVLSTTCPHCEKTLANWAEIVSSKSAENCSIFGISIDDIEKTRQYITSKKVSFYTVSAADVSFQRKYKITGVPQTILLRGDGSVEKIWIGELSEDQSEEIQTLMSASK